MENKPPCYDEKLFSWFVIIKEVFSYLNIFVISLASGSIILVHFCDLKGFYLMMNQLFWGTKKVDQGLIFCDPSAKNMLQNTVKFSSIRSIFLSKKSQIRPLCRGLFGTNLAHFQGTIFEDNWTLDNFRPIWQLCDIFVLFWDLSYLT